MLHLLSSLGFLVVAVASAGLVWHMLATRSDAILAALRMAEPLPALPARHRRIRVTSPSPLARTVAAAGRRAA